MMTQVHEFSTWQVNGWAVANESAIAAAKAFAGDKYVVTVGEWGGRTFMVLGASSKDEAKQAAMDAMGNSGSGAPSNSTKVVARNVTNAKKYQ